MSLWMKPALTPTARIDGRHPLAVAAGEVIVHGDDVNALAFEGVEDRGQRGDKGFAFAGDHFGDVAAVQDDAAEDLRIEMPHVLGAAAGFTDGREHLGHQVVEPGAVGQPLLPRRRQLAQFLIAQRAFSLRVR